MRLARTSVLFLLIGGAIGAPLLSLSTHTAPPIERAPAESSSQHLLQMIESDGARQTAETLSHDHKWSEVRQAVTSGQPDAARVVPELMPLADPGTARSLQQAMRTTLPRHPATVLAETTEDKGMPLSTDTICKPVGMNAVWRAQVKRAVTDVHDLRLAVRAKHCLDALGTTPRAS